MKMSRTFSIAILIALFATACAQSVSASAESTMTVLDSGVGGSIIFYSTLADQMLDADLVIVGRTTGAEAAGSEGRGLEEVHYIHVLLTVDKVIHSSGVSKIEAGDELRIEQPLPLLPDLDGTIDEVGRQLDAETQGVHFLFNAQNLRSRLRGDASAVPPDLWLHQNGQAFALKAKDNKVLVHEKLVSELAKSDTFTDVLQQVESQAAEIKGQPQPASVIGLEDNTDPNQ